MCFLRLQHPLHRLRQDGPKQDYEHCGENAEHQRTKHLRRRLVRQLLGAVEAPAPQLLGLYAEYRTDRDAQLVGLDKRECDGPQVALANAVSQLSASSLRDWQLRWRALMKSMPASTESVKMSRTNGRAFIIARWRFLSAPLSHIIG